MQLTEENAKIREKDIADYAELRRLNKSSENFGRKHHARSLEIAETQTSVLKEDLEKRVSEGFSFCHVVVGKIFEEDADFIQKLKEFFASDKPADSINVDEVLRLRTRLGCSSCSATLREERGEVPEATAVDLQRPGGGRHEEHTGPVG